DLVAINGHRADHIVIAKHRYGYDRTRAAKLDQFNRGRSTLAVGSRVSHVSQVDDLLGGDGGGQGALWMRDEDLVEPHGDKFGWHIAKRHVPHRAALNQIHHPKFGAADPHRILQHPVKDRGQIAWRRTDHLKHIGGRGLLLERLFQVTRPGLYLLEQLHVLNSDHSLIGKGAQELLVLVGKCSRLLPCDTDGADDAAVTPERHRQSTSKAARPSDIPARLWLGPGLGVDGLLHLAAESQVEAWQHRVRSR